MSEETRDPPELRVIDGGVGEKRKTTFKVRGKAGRWTGTKGGPRAHGLDAYEKAAAAYLRFPGNHAQASKEAGVDSRTCRRFWEIGLRDNTHVEVAPAIKDMVAERVRLLQKRMYGDVARQHELDALVAERFRESAQAEKEEFAAIAQVRHNLIRVLNGLTRGGELVGAMIQHQITAHFDVEVVNGVRVLTPKDGVKIGMGDTWKACSSFAASVNRLGLAARHLRVQGVKDREAIDKLRPAMHKLPAELLNEQAQALEGTQFLADLAAGRVRFADEPAG
jgi:hypothetical protein